MTRNEPAEASPVLAGGVYFINVMLDLCGIGSTQNQQDESGEDQE